MVLIQKVALDESKTPTKVWEHRDAVLEKAPCKELGLGVDPAKCLRAYFDRGCKIKLHLGSRGYLVYKQDGELLLAATHYYGHEGLTSNMAEARALVDCIVTLGKVCWGDVEGLVVTGNSKLIISFMHRTARPGKRKLVTAM